MWILCDRPMTRDDEIDPFGSDLPAEDINMDFCRAIFKLSTNTGHFLVLRFGEGDDNTIEDYKIKVCEAYLEQVRDIIGDAMRNNSELSWSRIASTINYEHRLSIRLNEWCVRQQKKSKFRKWRDSWNPFYDDKHP